MIKCDKGIIEIKGDLAEINAELTLLTMHVYRQTVELKGEDYAKHRIEMLCRRASMTDEAAEEVKEKIADILRRLGLI